MKYRWVVLLAMALLVSACGSPSADSTAETAAADDEEVETREEAETPPTSAAPATTAAPTTTTSEPASASTMPPEEIDRVYQPLPQADDPCAEPVQEGSDTFSIFVDGSERPVYVEWPEYTPGSPPRMVVGFHGAGWGIDTMKDTLRIPGIEPHIFVVPSPQDVDIAFWSETAEFDLNFVSALFADIPAAFCFDSSQTILNGIGQGALLTAEAICNTEIPIQLVVMSLSFVSPTVCEPARDVPIIAHNTFDFLPPVGAHWDGRWDPPVAHVVEWTDGIGPVPEDLDEWAARYGCEGPRLEETLPDPDDVLERDSVLFAYPDCNTPLFAFGYESDDMFPTSSAALALAIPRRVEVLESILAE